MIEFPITSFFWHLIVDFVFLFKTQDLNPSYYSSHLGTMYRSSLDQANIFR